MQVSKNVIAAISGAIGMYMEATEQQVLAEAVRNPSSRSLQSGLQPLGGGGTAILDGHEAISTNAPGSLTPADGPRAMTTRKKGD